MYPGEPYVTVADAFRLAHVSDFVFAWLCTVWTMAFG
jgi:hypothetical protein